MNADLLAFAISLYQESFIQEVGGRQVLHGEAKEVVVNEMGGVEVEE